MSSLSNMASYLIQSIFLYFVFYFLLSIFCISPLPTICDIAVLSNDPPEPGYLILNPGWKEGGTFKFTAIAQKFEDRKGPLAMWTMKIEFSMPIASVQAFTATVHGPYYSEKIWLFKPMKFNDGIGNSEERGPIKTLMIAELAEGEQASEAVVTFCRNGAEPHLNPDSGLFTSATIAMTSISTAKITNTWGVRGRCADSALFGRLPSSSNETQLSGYTPSSRKSVTTFDYNEVLHMSILFYEAQRSGRLPADNRIPWRGDSGLKDGCDVGIDLTGGYHDAGDNVKFGFPMAYTATILAWGLIEFEDSYDGSGDLNKTRELIKWFSDYFVKSHTSKFELYVQVGDPELDHSHWMRPEEIIYVRKSYKIDDRNPGTEVAAETAAALAAASIVLQSLNATYSETLISHARDLYKFANKYRRRYHFSIPSVTNFYKSWNGFDDELLWAAIWLYKATKEQTFLDLAESQYDSFGGGETPKEFSWDNKYAGVQILLAQITKKSKYRDAVDNFYSYVTSLPTTPFGMTWVQTWGPNRYAANFAWTCVMAAQLDPEMNRRSDYLNYARKQINYLLGNNEKRISYVVGHTENFPKRPHHRSSSCPTWSSIPRRPCLWTDFNNPAPNPHVLYGALVGGPDRHGNFADKRMEFVHNEVALDYNAGFQSALAGLQHFASTEVLQA